MTERAYETILFEKDGPVATLTMNRPEHMNGMTNRMLQEAGAALTAAAQDPELRILVLTGAGRAFCPGADLHGVTSGSGSDVTLRPEDFKVPVLLHEMPLVTIAAVNGACAGAGFGWACACDMRIAARSAKFNTAFLDVGVAGDMGGPWTLSRLVGPAKARELYLLGDIIDAEEAARVGLVTRVMDDDVLADETMAVARRLAMGPRLAYAYMKRNLNAAETEPLAAVCDMEAVHQARTGLSDDHREAVAAFAEKRRPLFKGR